ncbi:hypothetical protein C8F01DRAFT_1078898 [Mycena amicta]|nr:hypothetical protein C8F01DRAFT_1078898 [Mycena amicta]
MIRIDSTPLVLALVASKGVNALVNARSAILDDETPDRELERHAYLRQVVIDASLDMLQRLDPTAPYATIVQRGDLYVDPSVAPPTLDVVSTDSHLCSLCKQVKSHPVLLMCSHSFCFVCLRIAVNTSWLCPHPGCAEVQHRPPIPLPSLQADIENTYVGFLDFTEVKLDCQSLQGSELGLRIRLTQRVRGRKEGKKAKKEKKDKKSKGTATHGIRPSGLPHLSTNAFLWTTDEPRDENHAKPRSASGALIRRASLIHPEFGSSQLVEIWLPWYGQYHRKLWKTPEAGV